MDKICPLNDHRRHLNESQRGMVGAKLANLQKGGEAGVHKSNGAIALLPPVTQKQAADMLNIGRKRRSVSAGWQGRGMGQTLMNTGFPLGGILGGGASLESPQTLIE